MQIPIKRALERFPDPRLLGILPLDCAPQLPLVGTPTSAAPAPVSVTVIVWPAEHRSTGTSPQAMAGLAALSLAYLLFALISFFWLRAAPPG